MNSSRYDWSEITDVPEKSGIYAWYYRPEITDFDLNKVVLEIEAFKKANDDKAAKKTISDFLNQFIFKYFRQEPYKAKLMGQLKPNYEGFLDHKQIISDSLIDRIYDEPLYHLSIIKSLIETSAPEFASPLYIGMSKALKTRLLKHKNLIEKHRNSESANFYFSEESSFAIQVCRRNIVVTRLFVIVKEINTAKDEYIDIENILNRIYYPLLRRN